MKLSPEKQKKFVLTFLVMALAVAAIYFLVIQGLTIKQKADTAELKHLRQEIVNKKKEIQTEKNDRESAKQYQAFIAASESEMPKGNIETWLVKELSEIAIRQKLELSNTIIQPIRELSDFKFKDQPYRLEGVHFEFQGDFNQIGKFLEDIENNRPLMEVDDLTITAGSARAPYIHTVSMRVSMVTKS